MVLCCYHVLLAAGRGDPGDPIGQLQHDGTWTPVATLYRQHAGARANADAALAVLDNPDIWSNDIEGLSIHPTRIAEKSEIKVGVKVLKSGSVTNVTEGTIERINAATNVTYELTGKTLLKIDQLKIQGSNGVFSRGGDSGACLISEDGTVIGMVISGNEKTGESYATPMYVLRDIFDGFSLRTH